jgi:hypothetical protein
MYKKVNWLKYGSKSEIIEILVKDFSGRELDFFRTNNKKECAKIGRILKDKYGFNLNGEKDTNELQEEINKEREFLKLNKILKKENSLFKNSW